MKSEISSYTIFTLVSCRYKFVFLYFFFYYHPYNDIYKYKIIKHVSATWEYTVGVITPKNVIIKLHAIIMFPIHIH